MNARATRDRLRYILVDAAGPLEVAEVAVKGKVALGDLVSAQRGEGTRLWWWQSLSRRPGRQMSFESHGPLLSRIS
jgi:hypothetical protein